MSLRPEFSGFSFAAMKALLGSGDKAALASLHKDVEESFNWDEPEELEKAKGVLTHAIMKGAPISGLDFEEEHHLCAAAVLARHGQERLETGSSIWKWSAMDELLEAVDGKMAQDARTVLSHLFNGRPIFGKSLGMDWTFYSYLHLQEVQVLHGALDAFAKQEPDREDEGFLDEFLEWLEEIRGASKDLWLFAS